MKELAKAYPIIEILRNAGYTPRKKGRVWSMRCPFHNEKTPSFTIYPDTNNCYCFGCKKGGDSIWLMQMLHNIPYKQAVEVLAKESKTLPQVTKPVKELKTNANVLPNDLEKQVYKEFFNRLEYIKPNDKAYNYLVNKRKLKYDIIKKHNIRWVKSNRYISHLGRRYRNIFYKRGLTRFLNEGTIVFPFFHNNEIVYMQGREIIPKNPKQKYINLIGGVPVLYGIDDIKNSKEVFLAEGLPDCLALRSAGYPAIAMVSTIFKKEWLKDLENKTVIITIDDDGRFETSKNSSIKIPAYTSKINKLSSILKQGKNITVKVLHLPIKWDINDFLKVYPNYDFNRRLQYGTIELV